MFKNFISICLVLMALFSQQAIAATASLSSADHILELFEKEIVPSNAEFVFNIYANSKIPFLGFSLYSNQVVDGH